jgi:hypothetical protein
MIRFEAAPFQFRDAIVADVARSWKIRESRRPRADPVIEAAPRQPGT